MDLKIREKIAVVTASSRGLGRAVAEALAAEGVSLALCSRDKAAIEKTAAAIKEKYRVEVLAGVCDVTDPDKIDSFKDRVIERFGACHILFANAGGPAPGKVEDFAAPDFRKALELNLLSAINLINAFLPFMKQQKWGRILASTSISVKQPIPTLALSNVSRVGVVAFIKTLSLEIASLNITANTLAPGYIMTERVKNIVENQAKTQGITYEKALNNLIATIPAGKIATPGDFGALCAFLASEFASYITGETILIDGGLYRGLM